ncbi:Putative effector of murein hydrolase LrgA, UPF0299 family [Meinhardsimonia xiamenensis]|jgi:putative effector of murein hydrolase LrgA (UPF0299 family)|uniref:Putative effector of murein hydrolase LrgA, UPF0299 family n=1 Tax=Meinhardsimonia xiamenensis TaxID=990712 RepID=A0A1G8YL94_9RHOB|nr:CidA/LrgA family protein [Meinhardsimonia xiamenensis]PRX37337.1 putative effector of murein hydrolase LrgA (UPF0299 family) [Meinhardsimonia xiamenensis]SDK03234.1 Putative effector of murein hydrolase LrgA, UPF0299 family [Meinhardsimonia xiamenensis]
MIAGLALLLSLQLAGELAVRALGLPLPGPVLGMAGLLAMLSASPRLGEVVAPTAGVLLANLSLLFVPAGVGVVAHLDRITSEGAGLALALVGSTVLALLAGVGAFLAVARWIGAAAEEEGGR